jgi:hypothetical protein
MQDGMPEVPYPMTIPQEPPTEPEIQDPTLPENRPIDTPTEVPELTEPEIRAPGSEDAPINAPREDQG